MIKKYLVLVFSFLLNWFGFNSQETLVKIIPTLMPTQTTVPTMIEDPKPTPILKPKPTIRQETKNEQETDEDWGVARQIDDHTWTMKVGMDEVMASPKEIMDALNEYRRRYGSAILMWDEKLTDYAVLRAKYFSKIKRLDAHKGFSDFLENDNGFEVLGFSSLGENASFGYKMSGTHLIEWIYAADKPHDDNQKNSKWAYVGIGIDGTSTCLIFGTGKS